jgi:putative transposase
MVIKMRKHSPDEIRDLLNQADSLTKRGLPQADICSSLGISVMTYHRWRKMSPHTHERCSNQQFAAHFDPKVPPFTSIADLQRLRELQLENQQLRKIISDLMLERLQILEGVGGPDRDQTDQPAQRVLRQHLRS